MSMFASREHWATERIEARLWHCGDEECNCYEPQIQRITPNRKVGYPWILRETIWSGTFISDPDTDEYDGLLVELRAACRDRDVAYPYDDGEQP